jgi:glycosyltransferase involved in cell wall biosynthesis
MRILYLSNEFPLPINNGHRMRIWSFLEVFAREGHELTIVSLAEESDLRVDLSPLEKIAVRVERVPHVLRRLVASADYPRRLRSLFSTTPYGLQRFASREMRSRIEDCIRKQDPEVVVCDSVFSAVNLPDTEIPLMVNNPDVEFMILLRYLAFERNPAIRIYVRQEANKVRRWETSVCQRAQVCMACSEHDRKILAGMAPHTHVTVVPNVVDTDTYLPHYDNERPTLIFQGGLDWFPNRDGVEFFLEQIFPPLRNDFPQMEFIAAGRNPSAEMLARFGDLKGVRFTGTVPDMRPYLEQATVCVVPLRMGSGTRLKILEAAAAGKAIVSTHLGAEGLAFSPGKEILLADRPEEFAAAVKSLLLDPQRRASMAKAARLLVEKTYSYPALTRQVAEALKLVKTRGRNTQQAAKSGVTMGN